MTTEQLIKMSENVESMNLGKALDLYDMLDYDLSKLYVENKQTGHRTPINGKQDYQIINDLNDALAMVGAYTRSIIG